MEIMDALYNRGLISYPRTETNIFNPTINLRNIVTQFFTDLEFGYFASKLLIKKGKFYGGPRKGTRDDNSHPPIHPVKVARETDIQTP